MRGSIYFQTAALSKAVFQEGAKKQTRIDENHSNYKCLAGYESMDSYRKIWNNFGLHIYEVYGIKDYEKISNAHIIEFMKEKIFNGVSHVYLQKISSALGKLEFALTLISKQFNKNIVYNFSGRLKVVKEAKEYKLTQDNYRDRAYIEPEKVIALLDKKEFKIAANIQLFGGARQKGIFLIKKTQLLGSKFDKVTKSTIAVIKTKEKGGKVGEVNVDIDTYNQLLNIIEEKGIFKINYNQYAKAIRNACRILGVKGEGTHGFRWNFAQRRIVEYQNYGYSYRDSLQMLSFQMKHFRPDISSHYIG